MDSKREDSSMNEDSDDGFAVITSKKVSLKNRVKQLTEENKELDVENSSLKWQMDRKDKDLSGLKFTCELFESQMKDVSKENMFLKMVNNYLSVKVRETEKADQLKLIVIEELRAKVIEFSEFTDAHSETNTRLTSELMSVKDLLKQKTTELDNETKSAELRIQEKDKEISALKLKVKSLELEKDDKDKKMTALRVTNFKNYKELILKVKMIVELEAKVRKCSEYPEDQ